MSTEYYYNKYKELRKTQDGDLLSQSKQDSVISLLVQRNIMRGKLSAIPFELPLSKKILSDIHFALFDGCERLGFFDYREGLFREELADYEDRCKVRAVHINNIDFSYLVSYSRMTSKDLERLDELLSSIKFDDFIGKSSKEIASSYAKLYAELDYIHPFYEGNSRTLRTFLSKLSNKIDINLDWTKIDRQELYFARDVEVNKLATSNIYDETFKTRINHFNKVTSNRLQKPLAELISNSISLNVSYKRAQSRGRR